MHLPGIICFCTCHRAQQWSAGIGTTCVDDIEPELAAVHLGPGIVFFRAAHAMAQQQDTDEERLMHMFWSQIWLHT
jgi:hypothetical protein